MAFAKVVSQVSPSMAVLGVTGPVAGTDDLLTTGSPIKFTPRMDFVDLRTHSTSFTKRTGIVTSRLWDISAEYYMMGNGTNGTAVTNGITSIKALLAMAAMTGTVGGATVTYAPSTITAAGGSATGKGIIWGENNGLLHKGTACVGNVVLVGTPTDGWKANWTGVGIYAEPTLETIGGSWGTGLSNTAKAFLSTQGTIGIAGTNYTPVISRAEFNRGVVTGRVSDTNAATGINEVFPRDASPTLTLSIGMDTTASSSTQLSAVTMYNHFTANTTHSVNYQTGTTAGNIWKLTCPKAQLRNIRYEEGDGYMLMRLEYNVTHSGENTEFTLVHW